MSRRSPGRLLKMIAPRGPIVAMATVVALAVGTTAPGAQDAAPGDRAEGPWPGIGPERARAQLEALCDDPANHDAVALVCGADGRQYINACEAFAAGTTVANLHTCRPGMLLTAPTSRQVLDHLRRGIERIEREEEGILLAPGFFADPLHPEQERYRVGERGCAAVYAPACASDGEVYRNPCMIPEGIRFEHYGPCGLLFLPPEYDEVLELEPEDEE